MTTLRVTATLAILLSMTSAAAAAVQSLSAADLVKELQRGGYVIVMRHASSPTAPPDAAGADKENTTRERQLDDAGRRASTAMGEAFRRLRIPVGEVLTSPTYRAHETARLAGWASTHDVPALGDRGRSMQAITDDDAAVLRQFASDPASGGNRVVITHMPNIARAFPAAGAVADGEALVFKPGGTPTLIGRMKIDDWPRVP